MKCFAKMGLSEVTLPQQDIALNSFSYPKHYILAGGSWYRKMLHKLEPSNRWFRKRHCTFWPNRSALSRQNLAFAGSTVGHEKIHRLPRLPNLCQRNSLKSCCRTWNHILWQQHHYHNSAGHWKNSQSKWQTSKWGTTTTSCVLSWWKLSVEWSKTRLSVLL